jgi:predicted ferric reductase
VNVPDQLWWWLARAGGIVAAVLLVAIEIVGVLLATRILKPHDRPAWLLAMHRWLALLMLVGVGVHLGALVADSYVHFSLVQLVVPFTSSWKPGAVTFGVLALYVLGAVQVTSLLMRKLSKRSWRLVHLTSYLSLWLVVVHGALAGTDATSPAYRLAALALLTIAVSAALVRISAGRLAAQRQRRERPTRDLPARGAAEATT